jgi:hypothetical protein
MNQIYPYEQQMKETLRDLPGGDVERDWESMRKLLDEEGKKRRAGFIPNWQKAGLVCLFAGLLGMAIYWLQLTNRNQTADPALTQSTLSITEPESQKSLTNKDSESTLPHKNSDTVGEMNSNKVPEGTAEEASAKATDLAAEKSSSNSTGVAGINANMRPISQSFTQSQSISGISNRYDVSNQPTASQNKKKDKQNWTSNSKDANVSNIDKRYESNEVNTKPNTQSSWVEAPGKDIETLKPSVPDFLNSQDVFLASSLQFNQPEKISGTGDQFLPGYKIPVVVEGKKERRELKKSFRSINTNSVGNNVSFAAGLLIPTNISVAQQQRPGLNINAANNLITDYIPAAFLQYHITPKLFLHSEFQFQSPQLTNRLLMSQSDISMGPNSSIQNRVFVEKLYYFNLPISVHYSPLRNFYVGTGMQYSSLISGVAGYETQRIENGVSTNSNYEASRFQDDSLSSALRSSDFRWQMDANYYLNRFTFGARYNRALNNLVDIQVGNTRTQARNQNMQVYIRYNLWEEKRPR